MGYLGFLELVVVALVAASVLFGKGRKPEAVAVLSGALKAGTREVAKLAMNEAMKEFNTDLKKLEETVQNAVGDKEFELLHGGRHRTAADKAHQKALEAALAQEEKNTTFLKIDT